MEHPQTSKDHPDAKEQKEYATVKRLTSKRTPVTRKEPVYVRSNSCLELALDVSLPVGCYLTKNAKSKWQVMVISQGEG